MKGERYGTTAFTIVPGSGRRGELYKGSGETADRTAALEPPDT